MSLYIRAVNRSSKTLDQERSPKHVRTYFSLPGKISYAKQFRESVPLWDTSQLLAEITGEEKRAGGCLSYSALVLSFLNINARSLVNL